MSLPTNVSATVGQWLILVCLAKCLQDVCLGCLFPPPCPPPLLTCLRLKVASTPPPQPIPPHLTSLPLSRPVLWRERESGGGGGRLIIFIEGQRLPKLTEIFFTDQSHFLSLPTTTAAAMRCLFSVRCWCMMGEVLTQHWGAVTLHCQRSWLAYHSLHREEVHHHSGQGFPSLGLFPHLFKAWHLIPARLLSHNQSGDKIKCVSVIFFLVLGFRPRPRFQT